MPYSQPKPDASQDKFREFIQRQQQEEEILLQGDQQRMEASDEEALQESEQQIIEGKQESERATGVSSDSSDPEPILSGLERGEEEGVGDTRGLNTESEGEGPRISLPIEDKEDDGEQGKGIEVQRDYDPSEYRTTGLNTEPEPDQPQINLSQDNEDYYEPALAQQDEEGPIRDTSLPIEPEQPEEQQSDTVESLPQVSEPDTSEYERMVLGIVGDLEQQNQSYLQELEAEFNQAPENDISALIARSQV